MPAPAISAITWRDWGDKAFASALSEGKPVLLSLTATWCHWCHVMDETSYSHPTVIELVNQRFIPVRVDVDQRPDLSARYNQGGFPSLAFLDTDGRIIAGKVYTPPDEMIKLLEQVSTDYSEGKRLAPTYSTPSRSTTARKQGATQGPVLKRLEELYDTDFGGFGDEPKQPPFEGAWFLLSLYQKNGEPRLKQIICRTLGGIVDGLYDLCEGGFFRYSVSRDWKVPHYEKMLYTNARLASTFLQAFQVVGKSAYKNAAVGTIDYILNNLRDSSNAMFWASQDAGEEYYRLPWKDRYTASKPSIDTTIYTGWNAAAASALLHAFGVLGQASYLDKALLVLDTLWAEFDRDRGLSHVVGEPAGRPRFLSDQVHALTAFLHCYQITGNPDQLERAKGVMGSINRLFSASDGGFYDVMSEKDSEGPSLVGVRPVLENALLAEAFVMLATITTDNAYLDVAKATLEAFTGVVPGSSYLGPQGLRKVEEDEERLFAPAASAWARAMDMAESGPVSLVVVGDTSLGATNALVRASLKATTPGRVIQILDSVDQLDVVKRLGFPANEAPAVYLCIGNQCLAPIRSPRELSKWARPGALTSLAN
ncbi:MAG: hypothetical protein BZY81_07140 [SAR202 cluster bacterium Io17-Chloro-G4]|nr:MAG: hypothetical protein BZY81_07140 [SAR202 cluster bacterium Io17-Chloro-G4]